MNVAKSLWALVQGDPMFMRRVNGWLTIVWIVMIPVSYFAGWLNSVIYVSCLSLWALVSGHWSAWQAARVETNQEKDADVSEVLDEVRALRRQIQDATDEQWQGRHRAPSMTPSMTGDTVSPASRVRVVFDKEPGAPA